MASANSILIRHLRDLSRVCALDVADDFSCFILKGIRVPPGYSVRRKPVDTLDALIFIPENYPVEPPGVGNSRIYLRKKLRYKKKKILHYYPEHGIGDDWAWYCWHEIAWNPSRDDLITVLEVLRMHLSDPFGWR